MITFVLTFSAAAGLAIVLCLWWATRCRSARGRHFSVGWRARRSGLDLTLGQRQLRLYRYVSNSPSPVGTPYETGFALSFRSSRIITFDPNRSPCDTRYWRRAGFCSLAGRNSNVGRRYWVVAVPLWFLMLLLTALLTIQGIGRLISS